MNEEYYVNLRDRYRPTRARLIFIAESPPDSGKYLYDPSGSAAEPLFRALIEDVLRTTVSTKAEGLSTFQDAGYMLLDATYIPVNRDFTDRERNEAVLAGYARLTRELLDLSPQKTVPIILIKKNVCLLLEQRLLNDGFTVKNGGIIVPFPIRWQKRAFREAMTLIMD